ncbi:alpha/beta fold hydrolase family protein [Psychroflexus halocasei]|uniref:Alpha/beta hydrolase fold n=1 Tax=Psychroflexus halocasei TaxID=908615 RepID=A0A1H4E3I2_9FLAO|nr:hypothetical protein [Psychroflexus halocasei]SEA78952.1 hypothetical protein SAMN05421540_1243 [Psychroflexus halocasei]
MKKYLIILALITISCKGQNEKNSPVENSVSEIIKASEFELIKAEKQQGLLILFPCFPCDAENTLSEFKIAEISIKNGFSVLAMNLNERLYLEPKEKKELAEQLAKIIQEQNLPKKNIFIGGFSSGGNVSLLICDYLKKTKNPLQPKGVFVVDSPVDLLQLYKNAEENIKLNFSKPAVQESKWIINLLDTKFGKLSEGMTNYELNSPYTFKTQNIENIKGLKNMKIRFYSEPDLKWWKESSKRGYEDLNAFYIEKLSKRLKKEFGNENVELITTENQGYRANGQRHPHSWSIVDEKDLINWILK